jgi:asparagine synthase (glutamine-hydrolysing)
MCGLAGRFHPAVLPPAPEWCARADALLAHRGPDGQGAYRDAHCELVHRRLALVDLSATGHQPMPNEDASVYVVFNGEIYNHRALRAELEGRGHVFRGTSDTETLVHLYEDLGERMVERLRGIFAFAIYDRARRRVLLARDRFGVKPLFYAEVGGGGGGGQWVFASEIKAIAALPGFQPELDRQACYDFLGLGYIPEPATGFANVAALAPGTTMVIDTDGARRRAFHRVEARADARWTLDAGAEEAATALLEAVASQSVADVPVAALLSGGIDSSLVVAARRRATGGETTTFNVRFPDASHDETPRALAVAAHYGTRHITVDLPEGALRVDAILDLLRHFDQPFADTSLIPTYWIARAVREHGIICTLSGDGGDEGFGGYPLFWRANSLVRLARLPAWTTRAAAAVGDRFAPWTQNWGRQVSKAAALADAGRSDVAVLMAGLSNYLSEAQKEELVPATAREALQPVSRIYDDHDPMGTGIADLEHLSRRLTESQFAVSLPSQMLRKVDMMSMRASIEVRVPLLDEHVVDVGLSLPHALKTDGRKGKRVLRALADRWLPAHVAQAGKRGFSIPLDVMAPPELHTALEDLLLGPDARTRGCTNPAVLRAWLHGFRRAGGGDHTGTLSREGLYRRLVSLLALELWLREYRLVW